MTHLERALELTSFDPESIDLPLLIGMFARLKGWAEAEPHLLALGKKSMCAEMRELGGSVLDQTG